MEYTKNIVRSTIYLIALATGFTACLPESGEETLGPAPTASFTVKEIEGEVNKYLLTSTSENVFMYFWNINGDFEEGKATDTVYFAKAGEYDVTLRVVGAGGISETSESVSVAETDPDFCSGNHKFAITANTLKVTGLGAHLGLYKVGEGGTIAEPGNSITYDIVSITENLLVVKKEYDWGGWKFTLKAVED